MSSVHVPRESVNDQSVLVQKVLVPSGGTVAADQVVVEIETSKTVIEITAPEAGLLQHALREGQEIEVGALLFTVGEAATPAEPTPVAVESSISKQAAVAAPSDISVSAPAPVPAPALETAVSAASGQPPLLSKAAQAAAAQLGRPLDAFAGRWVTRADIERGRPAETRAENAASSEPRSAMPAALPIPMSLPTLAYAEKAQPMRKRAEVENLIKGHHAETVSTIGVRIALPGTRIVEPSFLFRDSISDLVMFEGARLLRQFPELNAFHLDAKRAGHYEAVNFGVSFDNVANLKVLTLHDADRITLPDLHSRFSDLLDLFESNKPIPADLLGTSTVTISDLSTTGASFMLPLINGHQSLILGVVRHNSRQFEIFASFDHRVSEGLRVTRFLEALRDRIVSHYRDGSGYARLCCGFCAKTMQDELRLGNRGLINMTLPSGDTALVCRNCFEGR
jgi:pyruvate/2-oxoglutarate dehydrogenase complex dihydrolipoamide acyltransferase (E2) component